MIDQAFWKIGCCDLCLKDRSLLEPRLVGIMEKGQWVGELTKEKTEKASKIFKEWYEEITCPCIVLQADMEEVVICEKHLNEIISKKAEYIK